MITALYANTNYDGKDEQQKRIDALQRMEDQFKETIYNLYRTEKQIKQKRDEENMWDDPFLKPAYKDLKERGLIVTADELEEEEYGTDQDG